MEISREREEETKRSSTHAGRSTEGANMIHKETKRGSPVESSQGGVVRRSPGAKHDPGPLDCVIAGHAPNKGIVLHHAHEHCRVHEALVPAQPTRGHTAVLLHGECSACSDLVRTVEHRPLAGAHLGTEESADCLGDVAQGNTVAILNADDPWEVGDEDAQLGDCREGCRLVEDAGVVHVSVLTTDADVERTEDVELDVRRTGADSIGVEERMKSKATF